MAARASENVDRPPSSSRIVLVSAKNCCAAEALPEVERLLAVELTAARFAIEHANSVAHTEQERRIELGVVAESHGARAAVGVRRLAPHDKVSIEIWLASSNGGRPLFRSETVAVSSSLTEASLVALRVTELLRTLCDAEALHLPTAMVPPAPSNAHIEMVPPHTLRLQAGGKLGMSPGGVPVQGGLILGTSWRWLDVSELSLDVGWTNALRRLTTEDGKVSVTTVTTRAWISWIVLQAPIVELSVRAGGGWLWFRARGYDGPGARAAELSSSYLGGGGSWRASLGKRSFAVMEANVGLARPVPVIMGSKSEIARLGGPLTEVVIGVGTSLF